MPLFTFGAPVVAGLHRRHVAREIVYRPERATQRIGLERLGNLAVVARIHLKFVDILPEYCDGLLFPAGRGVGLAEGEVAVSTRLEQRGAIGGGVPALRRPDRLGRVADRTDLQRIVEPSRLQSDPAAGDGGRQAGGPLVLTVEQVAAQVQDGRRFVVEKALQFRLQA